MVGPGKTDKLQLQRSLETVVRETWAGYSMMKRNHEKGHRACSIIPFYGHLLVVQAQRHRNAISPTPMPTPRPFYHHPSYHPCPPQLRYHLAPHPYSTTVVQPRLPP